MRVNPPATLRDKLTAEEIADLRELLRANRVPIWVDDAEAEALSGRPASEKFDPDSRGTRARKVKASDTDADEEKELCGRYIGVVCACVRAAGHAGKHTDDPASVGV